MCCAQLRTWLITGQSSDFSDSCNVLATLLMVAWSCWPHFLGVAWVLASLEADGPSKLISCIAAPLPGRLVEPEESADWQIHQFLVSASLHVVDRCHRRDGGLMTKTYIPAERRTSTSRITEQLTSRGNEYNVIELQLSRQIEIKGFSIII